jgi:hypothetical protein
MFYNTLVNGKPTFWNNNRHENGGMSNVEILMNLMLSGLFASQFFIFYRNKYSNNTNKITDYSKYRYMYFIITLFMYSIQLGSNSTLFYTALRNNVNSQRELSIGNINKDRNALSMLGDALKDVVLTTTDFVPKVQFHLWEVMLPVYVCQFIIFSNTQ